VSARLDEQQLARNANAADYRAQTPAPALWYLARGTGTMYVRTVWDANAFWGVFIVTITAGAGFAGHPLMFSVSTAADGCKLSEDTNVQPGEPPPGGGVNPVTTRDNPANANNGGCSCTLIGRKPISLSFGLVGMLVFAECLRRRYFLGE